jgi:hypothetical protein
MGADRGAGLYANAGSDRYRRSRTDQPSAADPNAGVRLANGYGYRTAANRHKRGYGQPNANRYRDGAGRDGYGHADRYGFGHGDAGTDHDRYPHGFGYAGHGNIDANRNRYRYAGRYRNGDGNCDGNPDNGDAVGYAQPDRPAARDRNGHQPGNAGRYADGSGDGYGGAARPRTGATDVSADRATRRAACSDRGSGADGYICRVIIKAAGGDSAYGQFYCCIRC